MATAWRFVRAYLLWLVVSVAGLASVGLVTTELLFLSAFVGLLVVAEYTEPQLSGTTVSTLVWVFTLVGFGAFLYTAVLWVQGIIASAPTPPPT